MQETLEKYFKEIEKTFDEEKIVYASKDLKLNIPQKDRENKRNELLEQFKKVSEWKIPFVLIGFYWSTRETLWWLFTELLKEDYNAIPSLYGIERMTVQDNAFKYCIDTFIYILNKTNGRVRLELALTVLYTDPKGNLFTEEQKTKLINYINKYLKTIDKKTKNIDYEYLEVIFDLTTFFNDDKTIKLLKEIKEVPFSLPCKLFYIKTCLANKFDFINNEWWQEVYNNDDTYKILLSSLSKIDLIGVIPEDKIDFDRLAKAYLKTYVKLKKNRNVKNIEIMKIIIDKGNLYYAFKFRIAIFRRKQFFGIIGPLSNTNLKSENISLYCDYENYNPNTFEEDINKLLKKAKKNNKK